VSLLANVKQDGNSAIQAVDDNRNTRWSGFGKGATLTLDLAGSTNLSCASIAGIGVISGRTPFLWVFMMMLRCLQSFSREGVRGRPVSTKPTPSSRLLSAAAGE